MLSVPEYLMWFPVVCESCEYNYTQDMQSDFSEMFDWRALAMLSAPDSPISLSVV